MKRITARHETFFRCFAPGARWQGALVAAVVLGTVACATAPEALGVRATRYLSAHPQTPPETAEAIRQGRVLLDMDQAQVLAAVGPPERRASFEGADRPEVWLYHAARFPPSQPGLHGAPLIRVVFVDGRVRSIEPI